MHVRACGFYGSPVGDVDGKIDGEADGEIDGDSDGEMDGDAVGCSNARRGGR